jgi:hypothetical protein
MVSPQENYPRTAEAPSLGDRGIREPGVAPVTAPIGETFPITYRYFWGPVVAGTLTAITLFVLSLSLMFGLGVGMNANRTLSLGVGSAIWLIVTSAICYYVGGMLAARISAAGENGWLRGVTVWGLSVPLGLLILAFISLGGGAAAAAVNTSQSMAMNTSGGVPTNNMGFSAGGSWTIFIALIVGLACAVFGGMSGAAARDLMVERR